MQLATALATNLERGSALSTFCCLGDMIPNFWHPFLLLDNGSTRYPWMGFIGVAATSKSRKVQTRNCPQMQGLGLIMIGVAITCLMFAIATLPYSLILSTIRTATGEGWRAPSGCPMMEGYACSYSQKFEAGVWVFVMMGIGEVLLCMGAYKFGQTRSGLSSIAT